MERNNFAALSADRPLTDPRDDRLGYAPFAKHLADSICNVSAPEGLVIAINGPWGSGKTTLLNFVVHYLQQKPQGDQPIIVHFNPWWFSGHEDLARRFFDQLQVVLSKRKVTEKQLQRLIADFAELFSEAPLPYASLGKAVAKFVGPKKKDVIELKKVIVDALKKQKRRILVIIDDIDRLTIDEIRDLFRVVKAIADFPNMIYLLAFNKEVVIKAIEQVQGSVGDAYLEKLVQVSFELPLPDKTSLRKLFFERLGIIFADTPSEFFDQTYWANVYLEGIEHFITTPRDIVRLTNALSVTYPAVKGEVNLVDFVALETLRLFCPMAYDIIRKNPEAFAGCADHRFKNIEELKAFHNFWLEHIQEKDREPIKLMLMRVFPKLQAVWNNVYYGSNWETTWRRQLRACSLKIFPVYFRLAIPESSLSNTEIKAILKLTGDVDAFGIKLVELAKQHCPDGTTKLREFLERFEDYTEKDVPQEHIHLVVRALFDVGDQLLCPEDEHMGMFDFGNALRIGRIIWQLLRRLEEPKRFEVLKEAMSNGRATTIIVREVTLLRQQHGKKGAGEAASGEEEYLISSGHLQELENIALEKIRDAARNNSLHQSPDLISILLRWRDWAGEEAKQWVYKFTSDDTGLITLLEKFLQKNFLWSPSDKVGKIFYKLDYQCLELFIEPDHIINRVKNLAQQKWLTELQKTAIDQFIMEYEVRKKKAN